MLSRNKRFAVVAIAVALVFTLMPTKAKAEGAKENEPKKEEVAATPPSERVLDRDAPQPITNIGNVISKFKASVELDDEGVGHLALSGAIHKDCADHVVLSMDEFDEEKQVYPIRAIFYNFKDGQNACTPEKTRACTRYTCIDINQAKNALNLPLLTGLEMPLERTGDVKLRIDDLRYPEGDPEAIKDIDLVRGGLSYEDPETILAMQAEEEAAARKNQLIDLCKAASGGDRSAFQQLKDLGANPELINKLAPMILSKEMADLEAAVEKADSLKALRRLIPDILEFGKKHEDMRDRAAAALDALADKALETDTDAERETTMKKNINNQFIVAEDALKAEKKLLGRKDVALAVKTVSVKMNHAEWASKTGDTFFNGIANKTFRAAYNDVSKLANQSKDPDVDSLRKLVKEKAKARVLPTLYNEDGSWIAGLTGTELDQNFITARNQALGVNEQFQQLLGSHSNEWMPQTPSMDGKF